jgi:2,3-dihydroxybenzoate-AMP ligase
VTVTLDDVRAAMERAGVARYKWPERLEVVPELMTTKVGKVDKKGLRDDVARRMAQQEVPTP